MSDAIAAHPAFSELIKNCILFSSDYIRVVAEGMGKSAQTIRQYKAAPGSKSHLHSSRKGDHDASRTGNSRARMIGSSDAGIHYTLGVFKTLFQLKPKK